MKKLLVILLALTMVLAACGGGADDPAPAEPADENGEETTTVDTDLFITVATGPTSGIYYPIGGAFSSVIQNDLGFRSSAQSTGASVENINLLLNGQAEMAIAMADAVTQAYEAFGAFEDEEPKEELRGLMSLYPNYVQLVAMADSGIESFSDLEGKRVGIGAPNSGVELNARLMFEAHGMSYDDINEDYLNYGEAVDQMRNGMIDAAFVTSGIPNATVMDLGTTNDIRIVPIEGDGMAYLEENYPFFVPSIIPAGTYDNDEDINTATIMNLMLIHHEVPEDAVYEITKGIFEHISTIHSAHNAAERHINMESVMDGMIVPLHPGAERFFQEEGVID